MKDTESEVSKQYALALTNVMHHGVCLFRKLSTKVIIKMSFADEDGLYRFLE